MNTRPRTSQNKTKDDQNNIAHQEDSNFSISLYFDPKAFMCYQDSQQRATDQQENTSTIGENPLELETLEVFQEVLPRKSVFHNLSKHIVTLMKKTCQFGVNSYGKNEAGIASLALWQLFVKEKSSSRRVFSIIFGFPSSIRQESELNLLALEFKEFRKLSNHFQMDIIMKAQSMIRSKVSQELNNLNRETMEVTCRMKNFNIFYLYYMLFMKALKEGSVDKRISKEEVGALVRASLLINN